MEVEECRKGTILDVSNVALMSLAVERGWMVIFYSKRSDSLAVVRKWSQTFCWSKLFKSGGLRKACRLSNRGKPVLKEKVQQPVPPNACTAVGCPA
eukprot:jgi/Botrbrau1/6174/Bobra.0344s0015.1